MCEDSMCASKKILDSEDEKTEIILICLKSLQQERRISCFSKTQLCTGDFKGAVLEQKSHKCRQLIKSLWEKKIKVIIKT